MAAAASPPAKLTAAITMAFAASTRPRRGLAANVMGIRPRRYSAVTNIVATTTTAISPANAPTRVWSRGWPGPAPPGSSGAMSPDPVTVNAPPAWWYPPGMAGEASLGPPPSWVPVQAPGAAPRRLTWSSTALARVGPPVPLMPSRPWAVVTL